VVVAAKANRYIDTGKFSVLVLKVSQGTGILLRVRTKPLGATLNFTTNQTPDTNENMVVKSNPGIPSAKYFVTLWKPSEFG